MFHVSFLAYTHVFLTAKILISHTCSALFGSVRRLGAILGIICRYEMLHATFKASIYTLVKTKTRIPHT